ncbi:MAG TPA: acyl-CoA dehydrogenase, partial [Acidimicrobiales bacterium]|nr:acyl-CoA dehydrogenase [Acidimicrobiales bacterium]
ARAAQGLTQFVLPADAPGIRIIPRDSIDLVRRFADVHFDGAVAPTASVVGTVGGAAADVEHQLQVAIVLQLAETVGAIGRVFEFTTEWAFDRFSFGRPLASYQELKHRFADMALWLEGARATTVGATRAVSLGSDDAAELVSVAKAYVGEHAGELVQDCVQMHGGIGITWDHDIHLYLRRVALNGGQYGTVRNHRQRLASLVGLA